MKYDEKIKKYLKSLKKIIAFILQKLPINSKYIGSPKGYHRTSQDYLSEYNSKNHSCQITYRTFLSPETHVRNLPKSINKKNYDRFENQRITTNTEIFLVSAAKCRTIGTMGSIITHDDKLLLDVSRYFSKHEHYLFNLLKLPKCQEINKTIAVLATASGETYYHWITEALPRVKILKHFFSESLEEIDLFVVNDTSKLSVISESLALLDIPLDKLIFADFSTHIEADTLVVPSHPGLSGDTPTWACEFLRESFIKHRSSIEPISKIYISREKASYRKVLNEESVTQCLSQWGFVTIYLEEHNFATQISLLANAEIIVAPHGAGLTNLIWCDKGTKILEMFSPNYMNLCFWNIADRLGLDYFYIVGNNTQNAEASFYDTYQDNINVPIEELSLNVAFMLQ